MAGLKCSVCTKRFNFQAQLNFHEKRHSKISKALSQPVHYNGPTPNRNSRRIVNFCKVPTADLPNQPFRISKAFLRIDDPELLDKLERAKHVSVNTPAAEIGNEQCTDVHPTEVLTVFNEPHPAEPDNDSTTVHHRNRPQSTPPQSLNVANAKDEDIPIIDISDDDNSSSDIEVDEIPNNSGPVAGPSSSKSPQDSTKVPKRNQAEIFDISDAVNMSMASPLATSTPKPKTLAQKAASGVPKSKMTVENPLKNKQLPLKVSLVAALQSEKAPSTASTQGSELGKPKFTYKKKCPHCVRTNFANSSHYENHLEVHVGKRPFVCPYCNFGYKTDLKLLEHVSTKHSSEPTFKCPTCFKENMTEIELRSHQCMQSCIYTID